MIAMCLEGLARSDASNEGLDGKRPVRRVFATGPAWLKFLRVYVLFRLFLDLRDEQYPCRKIR